MHVETPVDIQVIIAYTEHQKKLFFTCTGT